MDLWDGLKTCTKKILHTFYIFTKTMIINMSIIAGAGSRHIYIVYNIYNSKIMRKNI